MSAGPPRAAADFYRSFSYEVGLRDWLAPNPRHEGLKLLVDELLGAARGLRILDVGCGAGVLSAHLARRGRVTGVDLSGPAVELARALVPDGTFHAGALEDVDLQGPYDLVAAFDVLEHVTPDGRPAFLARVGALLAPGGRLLLSTPHPADTRRLHAERPELLQVVDEPVEPADVLALAAGHGLELLEYRVFDVDRPRQYQLFLLGPPAAAGGPVRDARLVRRLRRRASLPGRVAHRLPVTYRLLRAGRLRDALTRRRAR